MRVYIYIYMYQQRFRFQQGEKHIGGQLEEPVKQGQ
jgi:hypothetical protein